eukprot:g14494.t1
MTASSASLASVPAAVYLDRFNVSFYLEDALNRASTTVDPGSQSPPDPSAQLQALSDSFFSILDGKHITNRAYSYVSATPWNRRAFVSRARTTVFARLRRPHDDAGDLRCDAEGNPISTADGCAGVGDGLLQLGGGGGAEGLQGAPGAEAVVASPVAAAGQTVGAADGATSSSSSSAPGDLGESGAPAQGPRPAVEDEDFLLTMADFHGLLQSLCVDYPPDGDWRAVLELLLDETAVAPGESGPGLIGSAKFCADIPSEALAMKGAALEAWKQCSMELHQGAHISRTAAAAPLKTSSLRLFSLRKLDHAWSVCFVFADFVADLRQEYRERHVLKRQKILEMIHDCRKRSGESWLDYERVERLFEDSALKLWGKFRSKKMETTDIRAGHWPPSEILGGGRAGFFLGGQWPARVAEIPHA